MMRPSWDNTFLAIAATISQRSTCPRAHVGAVIVDATTHHVLGVGYNGSAPGAKHCSDTECLLGPDGGCLRTTHAEQNAVAHANKSSGIKTAYLTLSPCAMCLKLMIAIGVTRVVYASEYRTIAPALAIAEECGVAMELASH